MSRTKYRVAGGNKDCNGVLTKLNDCGIINKTNALRRISNAKYNQRMCFENDAKTLDLRHEQDIEPIPRFKSVTVPIKEYLFATCVVCYWKDVDNDITYITYGKELHKNSKSMDVKYVYLKGSGNA